jgi:hypothetical protein
LGGKLLNLESINLKGLNNLKKIEGFEFIKHVKGADELLDRPVPIRGVHTSSLMDDLE